MLRCYIHDVMPRSLCNLSRLHETAASGTAVNQTILPKQKFFRGNRSPRRENSNSFVAKPTGVQTTRPVNYIRGNFEVGRSFQTCYFRRQLVSLRQKITENKFSFRIDHRVMRLGVINWQIKRYRIMREYTFFKIRIILIYLCFLSLICIPDAPHRSNQFSINATNPWGFPDKFRAFEIYILTFHCHCTLFWNH